MGKLCGIRTTVLITMYFLKSVIDILAFGSLQCQEHLKQYERTLQPTLFLFRLTKLLFLLIYRTQDTEPLKDQNRRRKQNYFLNLMTKFIRHNIVKT